MKSFSLFLTALLCIQSTLPSDRAKLKRFIFDYERDFTASESDSLQQLLKDHYEKSGDEIVVLTTDSIGGEVSTFADHFAITQKLGRGNKSNSMVLALSIKDSQFGMVPNKKMQTVIPLNVLVQIKLSGVAELKAHQYFEGIWKECNAVIDYLEAKNNWSLNHSKIIW